MKVIQTKDIRFLTIKIKKNIKKKAIANRIKNKTNKIKIKSPNTLFKVNPKKF